MCSCHEYMACGSTACSKMPDPPCGQRCSSEHAPRPEGRPAALLELGLCNALKGCRVGADEQCQKTVLSALEMRLVHTTQTGLLARCCKRTRRQIASACNAMGAQRYDVGVVWMRRDLRLSDHPALSDAADTCLALVIAHVISNAALEPRSNQPGAATGVPQLGPHQLRCASLQPCMC
jgi:DNA photolyase